MLEEEQQPVKPQFDLSPRELEVLEQLVKGLSNKVIARNLSIEETTVKLHLRSLFRKLNVNNRTEAVITALDSGLFQPAP
jgi:DNA-binding NarL/FixJ family response regulator